MGKPVRILITDETEEELSPFIEHLRGAGYEPALVRVDPCKKIQAALEAYEIYKVVVENSPSGALILQEERVVFANPEIERVMGYRLNEVADVPMWEFIHPEDRERIAGYYHRLLAGEPPPEQFECRTIAKSGDVRHLEMRSNLIHYRGKPAIMVNVLDITDHRLAERSLRESEERYRAIVESQTELVCRNSRDGTLTFVNEAYCRYFGKTREELVGSSFSPIIPEQERRAVMERLSGVSCEKPLLTHEHRVLLPSGEIRWHQWTITAICDESGRLIEMQKIGRDITEKRRSESERGKLRRELESHKRQFYRQTILSVTDGKLDICDAPDIRPYISIADLKLDVRDASDVPPARHNIEEFCREHGLVDERLDLFIAGVGEAITNAVRHGPHGKAYAGVKEDTVWVGVSDRGPGIESLVLPKATLLRGFSTRPSLGLGYTIMLGVSDHIFLKTTAHGTTVILVKNLRPPETRDLPEQLPDTWADILE